MLTKQQFLNKHRAKYARLSQAEKNKRYDDYRQTQRGVQQRNAPVPRPARAINPFVCMVDGCSLDYPALDNTPVVRYQQRLIHEVMSDANGFAAFAVTPGSAISSSSVTYTGAITAGTVTWTGDGPLASGVTNMAKARIVGARLQWVNTQAPLNASGALYSLPFMPDNSVGYWPDNASSFANLPDIKIGKATAALNMIVPPARLSVLREFQDVQSPAHPEKFGNTPGVILFWHSLVPSTNVGQVYVDIVVELSAPTSASPNGRLTHVYPEVRDTPGVLSDAINWASRNLYAAVRSQPIQDTLSVIGTNAAANLLRRNASGPRALQ